MEQHDAELIQQTLRGNEAAFASLVHRYDRQVLGIVARYTQCADDAKDLYQDIFIRVYRGLPKFKFRSEFSTWIFRITTNVCLDYRAKKKNELKHVLRHDDEALLPVSNHLPATRDTDNAIRSRELASEITDAIGMLPPQQRMVFLLKHYEGMKLKDIASAMHCAEGTVKKYLFTAVRRLREELKDVIP